MSDSSFAFVWRNIWQAKELVANRNTKFSTSSTRRTRRCTNYQGTKILHWSPVGSGFFTRVYKLKFCLSVLLSVRNHFNISNLGPSNHPRIMSEPTYYTPLDLTCGWVGTRDHLKEHNALTSIAWSHFEDGAVKSSDAAATLRTNTVTFYARAQNFWQRFGEWEQPFLCVKSGTMLIFVSTVPFVPQITHKS